MRRRVGLCALGVVLAMAAASASLRSETENRESLDELAAARVKVAERALRIIELRRRAPSTQPSSETLEGETIAWWRRLMEAELDLSKTKAERVAAVRGYVDSLTKRHEEFQALHEANRVIPGQGQELVEYSLLEAKERLIRLEGESE